MRSGLAPMTLRLAAYHRGHSRAMSAAVALGPRCRAATSHKASPRRTTYVKVVASRRGAPAAKAAVDGDAVRAGASGAGVMGRTGRSRSIVTGPWSSGRPSGRSSGISGEVLGVGAATTAVLVAGGELPASAASARPAVIGPRRTLNPIAAWANRRTVAGVTV